VIHAPPGKSLASMMTSGELQAGFTGPAGIGRAGAPTANWEQGGQTPAHNYPELIPNVAEVEADWYRRTGIYPIHGTIVVTTDVLEKNPKVGRALFDAFSKAKAPYLERLKRGEGQTPEDIRYRGFIPLMGDPLPYGMAANRASIDALMTYALQQKLIPERMPSNRHSSTPKHKDPHAHHRHPPARHLNRQRALSVAAARRQPKHVVA